MQAYTYLAHQRPQEVPMDFTIVTHLGEAPGHPIWPLETCLLWDLTTLGSAVKALLWGSCCGPG